MTAAIVDRVVLVAHGSRRAGAEAPLHAIAQALVDGGVCAVADVVTRPFAQRRDVVDAGGAAVVVPMFLVLGDDSRAILAETWPGAVITAPIGAHPLIAAVVVARAIEAAPAATGPVVVVGHGSSRGSAHHPVPGERRSDQAPLSPCGRGAGGEGGGTTSKRLVDGRASYPSSPALLPQGEKGSYVGRAARRPVPGDDPLIALVDEVRRRLPAREVSVAFLEAQSPSIPAALDAIDDSDDSDDVVVVPAFFLHGQHTVVDIPALLRGRRRRAVLALPFLEHPLLIDAVSDSVRAAAAGLDR